jgi:ABC-type branched-subunit amino acid transport system ATPase component
LWRECFNMALSFQLQNGCQARVRSYIVSDTYNLARCKTQTNVRVAICIIYEKRGIFAPMT